MFAILGLYSHLAYTHLLLACRLAASSHAVIALEGSAVGFVLLIITQTPFSSLHRLHKECRDCFCGYTPSNSTFQHMVPIDMKDFPGSLFKQKRSLMCSKAWLNPSVAPLCPYICCFMQKPGCTFNKLLSCHGNGRLRESTAS